MVVTTHVRCRTNCTLVAIRNRIYEIVVAYDTKLARLKYRNKARKKLPYEWWHRKKPKIATVRPYYGGLTEVCRSIRAEYRPCKLSKAMSTVTIVPKML